MTTTERHATAAAADDAPATSLHVLHLFVAGGDRAAVAGAIAAAESDGCQVVTAAILGHKADLCVLALTESPHRLRRLQSDLAAAGCEIRYSYVSLTELSEYAAGVPEEMKRRRLRPNLPPEGFGAFCFYPMSKRRSAGDNWFRLDYEERLRLMREHGASGRNFAGRIVQLVTGSTGLDDFEWGVTLFGKSLDDVKDCVYSMRFDEASARFAEFGTFLVGVVMPPAEALGLVGTR